jgi:hypothetical protein
MPTLSPRQISDEPQPVPTRKTLAADSPIHPVSLLAGAGSAAVAAVIGGHLGLSGTVIGAAVGSTVAAVTATTIRTSVHRSRAAAIALASRRRTGIDPAPAESMAAEPADPAPTPTKTPWSGWARRGVTVGAGFALGIAALLLVQLGLGRNLSPGTDQLQSAAAKVVAAGPTSRSSTPSAHPTTTATTTVTQTAPATASSSPTATQTADPVKAPTGSPAPTASTTPSATPTPSVGIPTP